MEMKIVFPEGKKVEAQLKGTTLTVGGFEGSNGDTSDIEPIDLFFASLGLCAGKHIMEFCSARKISYEGVRLSLLTEWDEKRKMHTNVKIGIYLPVGFPEKYRKAILRVLDSCSVKKHILNPPTFATEAITR